MMLYLTKKITLKNQIASYRLFLNSNFVHYFLIIFAFTNFFYYLLMLALQKCEAQPVGICWPYKVWVIRPENFNNRYPAR